VLKKVSFLERKAGVAMTRVRFNKRKFFKFMYVLSVLAAAVALGNGDITSALVFALFI